MNNNENRKKYVWGMILPLILIFVIQNGIEIMLMEFTFIYDMGTYTDGSYLELIDKWFQQSTSAASMNLVYGLYSVSCSILFFVLYKKNFMSKERTGSILKGASSNWMLTIIGIIIFSFGMQYLCIYVMNAVGSANPQWVRDYEKLIENSGLLDDDNILMSIYAVVMAPICEELAFRGLAFKNARKIMPVGLAIVIQALLFGIFHGNMLQGCYTFVVGLGLGYVMYKYDNILITIVIHMIYNFIGTFLNEVLPFGGNNAAEFFGWLLGSMILTYLGVLLLKKGAPGVNNENIASDN